MKVRHFRQLWMVISLVAISTGFGLAQAVAAQEDQADVEKGMEVLTRGPVHEAFAQTVTFDPQPGIVVQKAPPDTIEEVPPEQKPEGANVAWIPGYWAWDDERSDFIWVSGIWRTLPPGRQWMPGYWAKSEQGFQWTSGYWADIKVGESEYLPEPPDTVEVGPNINAPSPEYSWIPGCWVWHLGRYAWRPGYWAKMRLDWVWVPSYYVWTPRGYIFVDGYWDYTVGRRGFLFAPVYFHSRMYTQRGFYYSPAILIDLTVFTDCLFLRPRYNHYYFGDYYAAHHYREGIYPWFSLHARRYGYDPIYAHQRWEHRRDREWEQRLKVKFRERRDHEEARPMRRLATPGELSTKGGKSRDQRVFVATPLDRMKKSKGTSWRFQSLNKQERDQIGQRGQELRKFREKRQELETKAPDRRTTSPSKGFEPPRARLPRSPIVAKSAERLGKKQAPPKRYDAPRPDPNVEPVGRTYGTRRGSPDRNHQR